MIEPEAEVVDAPESGLRNGSAQMRGEMLCDVGLERVCAWASMRPGSTV